MTRRRPPNGRGWLTLVDDRCSTAPLDSDPETYEYESTTSGFFVWNRRFFIVPHAKGIRPSTNFYPILAEKLGDKVMELLEDIFFDLLFGVPPARAQRR